MFIKIKEWWNNLFLNTKSTEIACPFCGYSISFAKFPGPGFGSRGGNKMNIVEAGSIVPCPKCGKNLSQFLRTKHR